MIIWLNGTFGVGKTTTADRLAALIPDGRVFDPETVGTMLRANLADRPVTDFQDWPPWPPLVAAALIEITRMTGQNVVAPQTVLKREHLDQVLVPLRVAGLEVFQVLLDADEAVLRSRIGGGDEAMAWRLDHLDEYKVARPWMVEMADLVVDTVASTPPQIARRILAGLPDLKSRPDAAKDDPAKADPAKADPAKADPAKTDPAKTDAAKADAAKADGPRASGSKADASKAGTSSTPGSASPRETALADK
ncbi:MAG TPA: AAA family ATPase [Streptosporangiaceae bacterium]|nr:AAA family ATPase [Streptosporangiaceae bacterium]